MHYLRSFVDRDLSLQGKKCLTGLEACCRCRCCRLWHDRSWCDGPGTNLTVTASYMEFSLLTFPPLDAGGSRRWTNGWHSLGSDRLRFVAYKNRCRTCGIQVRQWDLCHKFAPRFCGTNCASRLAARRRPRGAKERETSPVLKSPPHPSVLALPYLGRLYVGPSHELRRACTPALLMFPRSYTPAWIIYSVYFSAGLRLAGGKVPMGLLESEKHHAALAWARHI